MDLSFRPLLCSRAFRNIPKDHDASQASHIAKDHHENTVADNEANAPIDYQHL